MKKYSLLNDLLPLLEEYEKHQQLETHGAVEGFSQWLRDKVIYEKLIKDKRLATEEIPGVPRGEDISVNLGKMVFYMYRYARFYTKKALQNHVLSTLDEFTFLITLLNIPGLTKTELINKMVYEKTTGMEIINRLIRLGLIAELENPDDKRSKIISVTQEGQIALFSSFENLGKVSRIIPGNLTSDELLTLVTLLDKLDHHHLDIWNSNKDADLDTILNEHYPNNA